MTKAFRTVRLWSSTDATCHMGVASPFHTKCQTTGIEVAQQARMQKTVNDVVSRVMSCCYVTSHFSLWLCGSPSSSFPVTLQTAQWWYMYNVRAHYITNLSWHVDYIFSYPTHTSVTELNHVSSLLFFKKVQSLCLRWWIPQMWLSDTCDKRYVSEKGYFTS